MQTDYEDMEKIELNAKKSFSISFRNAHQTRAVDVNHVASKGSLHFDNQIKTLFFVSFSWCFLREIENNFLAFLSSNTKNLWRLERIRRSF